MALGVLFLSTTYGDQTGDCTAGEQYCEQNSLETTNTTTTNNTNTNTNTNTNNNTNTNVNTSTATNTNNSTNTNVNTSTSTVNSSVDQNVTNTTTTNNTNTSTSTSNNTNTNNNTNNNTNINQSTSESNVTTDNKNTNINESNTTSDNTNRNINESKSEQTINQNIKTEAPPASAIAPSIMSYSQDLCTVGRSGAFQGQVFGISTGRTVRDENCERLKLSKYLYDTGMKVASVGILCQDSRVFQAMEMAGTPCPAYGKIGKEASKYWKENPSKRPDAKQYKSEFMKQCKNTRGESGKWKSKRTCNEEFNNY